jgi:hypothetical protein
MYYLKDKDGNYISGRNSWNGKVLNVPKIVTHSIIATLMLIMLLMAGCPPYEVWQRTLRGEAELRQAEWNRQITIEEAQAKAVAAKSLAEAEVARAHGVAEANRIIAEGLGGPEGYLRYLWIQTLEEGGKDVIYVPTEANIPILEATRLK